MAQCTLANHLYNILALLNYGEYNFYGPEAYRSHTSVSFSLSHFPTVFFLSLIYSFVPTFFSHFL
jgi:hypothetical protein